VVDGNPATTFSSANQQMETKISHSDLFTGTEQNPSFMSPMPGGFDPSQGPQRTWIPAHIVVYGLGGTSQGLVFYTGYWQLGAEQNSPAINTNVLQYGGNLPPSVLGDLGGSGPERPLTGWGACAVSALSVAGGLLAIYQGPAGVAEIGALTSALGFGNALAAFADNIGSCEQVIQQALASSQTADATSLNDVGSLGDLYDPSGWASGDITFDDNTNGDTFAVNYATDAWANGDQAIGIAGTSGSYMVADAWDETRVSPVTVGHA